MEGVMRILFGQLVHAPSNMSHVTCYCPCHKEGGMRILCGLWLVAAHVVQLLLAQVVNYPSTCTVQYSTVHYTTLHYTSLQKVEVKKSKEE